MVEFRALCDGDEEGKSSMLQTANLRNVHIVVGTRKADINGRIENERRKRARSIFQNVF
jgi:hypothetical protein